jgi:hypothetical protein
MAVTVIIARDDTGAPTTQEVYADANKYAVQDGNLDVILHGTGVLGTYPSGNWQSVFMDSSVERIVTKSEDSDSDSGFGDFDFGGDDSSDSGDDSSDSSEDESSSDE